MWGGGGAYNAWAEFLERWAAGEYVDPAGLPRLNPTDFKGDSWARIADRCTGALSDRLRRWGEAVTRAVAAARDEFGVAHALTQARDGLRAVRALPTHPGLPEDLAKRLGELVDHQVESAQAALEAQVDQMRRAGAANQAVEARRRTIRDNRLTAVLGESPGGPAGLAFPPIGAPTSGRRRIIVD